MNDTKTTPQSAPAAGSGEDENPVTFWTPWILLCMAACVGFLLFGQGASACAAALLAHLFRAMASDDMQDHRPPNTR